MSRFQSPPFSGYQRPWDQIRKLPVKSTVNEWIPGYAIMYIIPGSGNQFWATEAERGRVIWRVGKPDSLIESLQDPALLIANGPTPIPPYGSGWGTQDWPAQVLHDGSQDFAYNGSASGPKYDSWLLWSGYRAFTVQSHDAAMATGPRTWKKGIHTLLVAPSNLAAGTIYYGDLVGGAASSYGLISIHGGPAYYQESRERLFTHPGGAGGSTDGIEKLPLGNTREFLHRGVYWIAVSATLSSPDAGQGEMLRMRVLKRSAAGGVFTPTNLTGYRLQYTVGNVDYYGGETTFYTAENVSFQGPLGVGRGSQIQLFNESQSTLWAADLVFSLFRLSYGEDPNPRWAGAGNLPDSSTSEEGYL